jgi:hypothetical protein
MEIPEDEEIFETSDGKMSGLFYESSFDASPGDREVISGKSCLHTQSPTVSGLKEGDRLTRTRSGEVYEVSASRNTGLGFYEIELRWPDEDGSGSLGRF